MVLSLPKQVFSRCLQKMIVAPLLCNLWVIEGNGPQRKKGLQHLKRIVLNERNWGVRDDRHAAAFS